MVASGVYKGKEREGGGKGKRLLAGGEQKQGATYQVEKFNHRFPITPLP